MLARVQQTATAPCATVFCFRNQAPSESYTLSLHDALPIWGEPAPQHVIAAAEPPRALDRGHVRGLLHHAQHARFARSEEHTSELQSRLHLVCRLLLEKKKYSRASIPPSC